LVDPLVDATHFTIDPSVPASRRMAEKDVVRVFLKSAVSTPLVGEEAVRRAVYEREVLGRCSGVSESDLELLRLFVPQRGMMLICFCDCC
jgi:hypothetical protein